MKLKFKISYSHSPMGHNHVQSGTYLFYIYYFCYGDLGGGHFVNPVIINVSEDIGVRI